VHTTDSALIADLVTVLDSVFNHPEVKQYYHLGTKTGRMFLFSNYYQLNDTANFHFVFDGYKPVFLPKKSITEEFYVEIIDINQNPDDISVDFEIHGEKVIGRFHYFRVNGIWWLRKKSFDKR
jgi:hypothetical protein